MLRAINIEWDVDCKEDIETLPKEIDIPEELTDPDEISDYLSDKTGFCHKGFDLVRKLNVTVNCSVTYDSDIMVPADLDLEEAIEYAKEHMNEIPPGVIERGPDPNWDSLVDDECFFEEE